MVTKEKLTRINELARIAKNGELTDEEKSEQKALREEYIEAFRKTFKKQLESIEFVD